MRGVRIAVAIGMMAAAGHAAAQQPARPAAQNQVLQSIADLYVSEFQSAVGLNDDQFLAVGPFLRQFIQMRFRAANQKQNLDQRLNELLDQAEPSEEEVQALSEQKAQLDRNVANSENALLTRLRPQLTARQSVLVLSFNKAFFEERLPRLLERARASVAQPDRQRPPASRPNQNKNREPEAGDAFRNR